jgi:hypothetical protein
LNLSLLTEDDKLKEKLNSQQKELLASISNSTNVIESICKSAISSIREKSNPEGGVNSASKVQEQQNVVSVQYLVDTLYMVLEPIPKHVPLIISTNPNVPDFIVTNDLKVFRSVVNYLTNALAKTTKGSVSLTITKTEKNGTQVLLFECEDTGPGIEPKQVCNLFRPVGVNTDSDVYSCLAPGMNGKIDAVSQKSMPHEGLGLYSVAIQISSLGGEYGYQPRSQDRSGSIFWFTIPLIEPTSDVNGQSHRRVPSMHALGELSSNLLVDDEWNPNQSTRIVRTFSITDSDACGVFNAFADDHRVPMNDLCGTNAVRERKSHRRSLSYIDGKRQKRALVVEDSLVVRKSLTRVLTKVREISRKCDILFLQKYLLTPLKLSSSW